MDEFILGYQYSPDTGVYVGQYKFSNNLDQDDIHWPPFTTDIAPPALEKNQEAFFVNGEWVIGEKPVKEIEPPVVEDYAMVSEWFIDHLRQLGKWTSEDDDKRAAALIELQKKMEGGPKEVVNTNIGQ